MKFLALLPLVLVIGQFTACSPSGIASRQEAISQAQAGILGNRATRISARDDRMWAAREVWFQ